MSFHPPLPWYDFFLIWERCCSVCQHLGGWVKESWKMLEKVGLYQAKLLSIYALICRQLLSFLKIANWIPEAFSVSSFLSWLLLVPGRIVLNLWNSQWCRLLLNYHRQPHNVKTTFQKVCCILMAGALVKQQWIGFLPGVKWLFQTFLVVRHFLLISSLNVFVAILYLFSSTNVVFQPKPLFFFSKSCLANVFSDINHFLFQPSLLFHSTSKLSLYICWAGSCGCVW